MGRGKKLRALAGVFGGTCACLFSALSGVVVFVVAAKRESARYQKGSTYRSAEISRGCSCIETPQLQYSVFKKAFRRRYRQKICLSAVIRGRQRAGGAGTGAGQAPTGRGGHGRQAGAERSSAVLCPELHLHLSKQMHSHKCYMLHLYFPSPHSLQIGHYRFTDPLGRLFSQRLSRLCRAPRWARSNAQRGTGDPPLSPLQWAPTQWELRALSTSHCQSPLCQTTPFFFLNA